MKGQNKSLSVSIYAELAVNAAAAGPECEERTRNNPLLLDA